MDTACRCVLVRMVGADLDKHGLSNLAYWPALAAHARLLLAAGNLADYRKACATLAQAAPAPGQEYIVKAGDTLASIANRADPVHAASLTGQLVRETGTSAVVPGEHIFIP